MIVAVTWGQGAANNSIGWGKASSTNSISWGKSHAHSHAGSTNITG